jgi:hypothetical protein
VVPPPPPWHPQVVAKPQLLRNPFNATREILVAAKTALKAVPKATDAESREIPPAKEAAASSTANVEKDAQEPNYVLTNPPITGLGVLALWCRFLLEKYFQWWVSDSSMQEG